MNKAHIIEKLLEQGHISVVEAMTLLAQEPTPIQFYYPAPNSTKNPYIEPPFIVTCNNK
jgi:hypothetical protein